MKNEDKNRLKGEEGNRINAVMSAAGMNFTKLLRHIAATFLRLFYGWVFRLLSSFCTLQRAINYP